MATAEAKPESKDMEENSLPPDSKIWVFKVYIHCEGCKKKVIKILHKIHGVYRTEVDVKQQKVTVVGNVAAETLIGSLEKKTRRRVELWPEPAKEKDKAKHREKKQSKSKNREEPPQQQQEQEQSNEGRPNNGDKKLKGTVEEKIELGPSKEPETSSKKSENGGASKDGGETSENGGKGKEAKKEAKQSETGPAGSQSPVPDKPVPAAENVAEKSESGDGVKKDNTEGQNGNNKNSDQLEDAGERAKGSSRSRQPPSNRASEGSTDPGSVPVSGPSQYRVHPPPQNVYPNAFPDPPPHYYMPPHGSTPVYTVSYHAAHPAATSYPSSYYGPPPPESSYSYMHPGQEIGPPPPYNPYHYPYPDQSPDVFERFSDENPNACSTM